jgi:adenylate kinase family enzyme
MINTKLILVDGLPGSGKSTIAHFLARQMELNEYMKQLMIILWNIMLKNLNWKHSWMNLKVPTPIIYKNLLIRY